MTKSSISFLRILNAEEFENKLRENKKIDMIKGTTSYGPHKDDYIFYELP